MLKNALVVTLMSVGVMSSGSALAAVPGSTTYTFGNISSFTYPTPTLGFIGDFIDITSYSIPDSSASYVVNDLYLSFGPIVFSDITNFAYGLYDSSNTLISSGSTVSAGNYTIKVTGTGVGAYGGYYGGSLTVSPVPEAGEWAMMLAGLGLMGFVAARRQKQGV